MIDRLRDEITAAQDRLREVQTQLNDQTEDLVRNARHQAHLVRGEGKQRLWTLENQALDWADDVLGRTVDVRGVEKVRDPLAKMVQQRRDVVTSVPVEGYDTLNARAAADAVRDLGWVELLRVERYETSNKSRKTVFQAIERRQEKLNKMPYREAADA